jgi:hypothetical protein
MTVGVTLHDFEREVSRLAPFLVFPKEWTHPYYGQGWSAETTAKQLTMILAGTEHTIK